ncbi:MAG: hypothetical protein KTR32_30440 [Granulosicoccus sp.]|nr:hypothetical protein [Granulosicoccus sp.]
MTNIANAKIAWVPLLFSAALLVQGCDRSSSSDPLPDEPGGSVVLDIPDANSGLVNLNLSDAQGNFLDDVRVMVIDDSTTGNVVRDNSENQLSLGGFVQIRLNDFTGDRVVRLEAEKSGFLSNGIRLDVTGGTSNEASLILTSVENAGDGINISEATGNLQQGNLIVEAVDVNQSNKTLTRIDVPQDIKITAVDGEELSGDLTITVAHYNSIEEQSLSAFPGGFSVNIENAENIDINSIEGAQIESPEIIFQSVGFAAIEIFDEFGNKADKFDGDGITITMEIPSSSVNPMTGDLIVAGDSIPIWSFDTDTANWLYEGTGTATSDGNGGLQVSFLADHLSYWNLDFPSTSRCTASVNVLSTAGGEPNPYPVRVSFRASEVPGSNRFSAGWYRTVTAAASSDTLTLVNAPASIPVTVSFSSAAGTPTGLTFNGSSNTTQPIDLCAGGTFALEYPPVGDFFDLNVSVTASCGNDETVPAEPLRSAFVLYRPLRESGSIPLYFWKFTNAEGKLTLNVPEGPGTLTVSGAGGSSVETFANLNQSVDRDVNIVIPNCPVTTGATGQE